jgi:hypothetical protein
LGGAKSVIYIQEQTGKDDFRWNVLFVLLDDDGADREGEIEEGHFPEFGLMPASVRVADIILLPFSVTTPVTISQQRPAQPSFPTFREPLNCYSSSNDYGVSTSCQ